MLQHRLIERRQLHHHARRQIAGIDREIAAAETRCAAECGGDVPHGAEMPHLLDGDLDDGPTPARGGRGLLGSEAVLGILQAEGRIEIGAHQIVLELGGFVEPVNQLLACGPCDFQVSSRTGVERY